MADLIRIRNLGIYAYHGVLESEKREGQKFYVNAELETDLRAAGRRDMLELTINYAEVCETIASVMQAESYDLIETCAERVAEAILLGYQGVRAVTIEIRKPSAPIDREFDDVSVSVRRAWHKTVIALGANLGDARATVDEAFDSLNGMPCSRLVKRSSIIKTEPYGVTDQPDFYNAAAEVETLLTPYELLEELHRIENEAGRVRTLRWGPRTLDLDIIFYDDLVLQTDNELCIPHIDMQNRDFVLIPLNEILPHWVHPLTGMRVCEMCEDILC